MNVDDIDMNTQIERSYRFGIFQCGTIIRIFGEQTRYEMLEAIGCDDTAT